MHINFEIIKKEFYQIRQDRRMLFVSMMAPVLQVILLGYVATTDIKYSNLVLCDMDKTDESRELVKEFTNSTYFVERFAVDQAADVDRYIANGKASIALVIPAGFGSDLLGRRTPQLQVLLDGTDANTASVLLSYATQIVSSYSQSAVATPVLLHAAHRSGRWCRSRASGSTRTYAAYGSWFPESSACC